LTGSIFSESWYKVANLRVSLNTNHYIKKQVYRSQEWYVVEDVYNNQFFKLTPEAYEFVVRLTEDKTVEQVWEECLDFVPEVAPTQDDVISILTSLHHKNLLHFKNKADSKQLYDRFQHKKVSELKGKLFSFLYVKVPLLNPDKWLDSISFLINILFSKATLIIWFFVLFLGGKSALENYSLISDQSQGMLAPSNLFLLYISMIFLKTLHELGHAMMVKKFGGRVNSMGVMVLIFTPIPFMDATQSWLFRSKWQRALVGAAGMMVELFIAAIAAIVWANSGDGLLHVLAFNIMIIGSVSSLFFNGNPLLRFDSYFILSDILEIPNLYEKSKQQWFYLVEKYIFDIPFVHSPSDTKSEAFWLFAYGFGSFFYRLLVAFLIAVFVADQWFFIGVLVVILSLYMWILKPVYQFFVYMFTSYKLRRNRLRNMTISLAFFSIIFILVAVIPFSYSIKANGIVLSQNYNGVYLRSQGYLEQIVVKDGDYVKKGQVLAIFSNKEIQIEIEKIEASIKEANAHLTKARSNIQADMVAVNKHITLLKDKLLFLKEKQKNLTIVSNSDGFFIYENFKNREKTWFSQGRKLGVIIPNDEVYFQAVVLQEDTYHLFRSNRLDGSIKLHGIVDKTISTTQISVIPYEKSELPSAALGWLGGGDIATSDQDSSGTKAKESFFEVRADIKRDLYQNMVFYHGRSGILKIYLDKITIFERLRISLKQILQKHYKI
jgi:putative peptide zinc metalloprotease protein